jgi:hypothetical protein
VPHYSYLQEASSQSTDIDYTEPLLALLSFILIYWHLPVSPCPAKTKGPETKDMETNSMGSRVARVGSRMPLKMSVGRGDEPLFVMPSEDIVSIVISS